jgi:predicted nucleic-acid-binding protein
VIAIDTNVLLRYVLQDDVDQARRATRLFTTSDSILIHNVVLTEAVWVLTGPKYRLSRGDVVLFVESLIEEPNVRFEDNQVVWQSIQLFKRAPRRQGKQADFADVLILLSSRAGIEAIGGLFEGWYTFDRGARQLDGAIAP